MTATVAGGLAAHNYEGRGARGKVRGPSGGGAAARDRPSEKKRARAGAAGPPRSATALAGSPSVPSRQAGGQTCAGSLQGRCFYSRYKMKQAPSPASMSTRSERSEAVGQPARSEGSGRRGEWA